MLFRQESKRKTRWRLSHWHKRVHGGPCNLVRSAPASAIPWIPCQVIRGSKGRRNLLALTASATAFPFRRQAGIAHLQRKCDAAYTLGTIAVDVLYTHVRSHALFVQTYPWSKDKQVPVSNSRGSSKSRSRVVKNIALPLIF